MNTPTDLHTTLEFLQTETASLRDEITSLREAIDRFTHKPSQRDIQVWKDLDEENEYTLNGLPEELKNIMRLFDVYCNCRTGPYAQTKYDFDRRQAVIDALTAEFVKNKTE